MAKYYSQLLSIFVFILSSNFLTVSCGRVDHRHFQVRAVNLGGWLVVEGWIKPSLFDAIPNKDLLDGTKLQFKSVKFGTSLSAKNGGGDILLSKNGNASDWETFKLWRLSATKFYFRAFNKQFVGLNKANNNNGLVAVQTMPSSLETFRIVRKFDDLNRVRIQASNGFFLQINGKQLVTADFQKNTTWEDDDPSVFLIEFKGKLDGDYQIANGYGPRKAAQVMKEHWGTYIVEDDFKFIAKNGLNTVRIPVGWWIASDPNPPKPYVAGSLHVLDNVFLWSERYGLKVIIDLHCAPGSQNIWVSRDGSQEWGLTNDNIQQTVDVIEFLTARYAKSHSLLAVELLNEPLSPGTSVETLIKYYKAGYKAVRKHSSTAYVILSNRLGPSNSTEFFDLARSFTNSVIDVHFYNLFDDMFYKFTVEQNLEYIRNNRSEELAGITKSDGPLIFVGEWVAEWRVPNASKRDYQKFAATQLEVYGQATFGWAYWCLKNVEKHWSMKWMIEKGYIKL